MVNGVSQQPYALRLSSQCELQDNAYSSVVEGLRKRPATSHVAKILDGQMGNAYTHVINRDMNERYLVVLSDGDIKVFDLDGNEKTVNFPEGKEYLSAPDASKQFRAITIADHTFVVNTQVKVEMDQADLSPSRGVEGIVFIKQASYDTTYSVTVDGYKASASIGSSPPCETTKVAEDLKADLEANLTGFLIDMKQSTLWIRREDGADFNLEVEDSRSNSHTTMAKTRTQRFSELPTVAPRDFTVEIVGDNTSNFDNYYVKFVPNNDDETIQFDSGVWLETVKPNIPWKFDASTMPHALVREADGTFTFKTVEWGQREVGDEESAQAPSFVGKSLNDIFFYRNRLGFLSDENCVLSQAAEFFKFFPSTVTTLVDSDPIDVAASHTKVSVLHHAIPFNEELLLFSDQTQFTLDGGDVLSPTTAAITNLTDFEASLDAKPVGAGKNVFFAVNKGRYSGIREYYIIDDTDAKDAAEITGHVPQYIPGGVHKLSVATNEDILAVLSSDAPGSVYIYKYYWSGAEKMQSSWGRWTFSGSVLNAEFLDTSLFLVVQYPDGVYMERMDVEPGHKDPDAPFEYHLDRKVTEAACQVSYDEISNSTTFVLPYSHDGDVTVVTRHGGSVPGKVLGIEARDGNAITVFGKWDTEKVFIGVPYTLRYRFSTQVIKEEAMGGGQSVVGAGRLQMRFWTVIFADTGYFRAEVTPLYRETQKYEFTGRVLGSGSNVIGEMPLENGKHRFPVMSKNDQVQVDLVNDSFLPSKFLSAEWEALYTIRSKRL
ncbi:hypothetical protein [Desulfovibrio oxyclinae]|uniref:phage nozzle protein n=1 Tax=Desulfovibrio oxyclinae TaxID=63560 RepID=UPI001FDF2A2C|nr:hypothetical protein [Desulfovibrio oxyclinae]